MLAAIFGTLYVSYMDLLKIKFLQHLLASAKAEFMRKLLCYLCSLVKRIDSSLK